MKRVRGLAVSFLFAAVAACSAEPDSEAMTALGDAVSETAEGESDVGGSTYELASDNLCGACSSNADCGSGNYCFRAADGSRFCGRDCRSTACSTGYTCMRLGSTFAQCIPQSGRCPKPADAGAAPGDAGTNDAGTQDSGANDSGANDAAVNDGGTADAGASDAGAADAGEPDSGAADAGFALDVPATAHCAPVASWDATWTAWENEVLALSNEYRRAGATCGATTYAPAAALTMDPALRCAARLHSKDMAANNYFSHTTPSGVTFAQRITATGYRYRTAGENIAWGYRSPAAVVTGWMQSEGHCRNLMNPSYKHLGVGFHGSNYHWTQDFAAPY